MRTNSITGRINYFLIVFFSFFCTSGKQLKAQVSYRVLFLGNSYTAVNNLPQLIHDVALSAGDTLIFDSYTPGGYRLIDHSLDTISQHKIMTGGWDYVIIQGQSQEPITQNSDFTNGGFALYNLIKQYNPCAVTMTYMTWGRKNGDASNCADFPEMCSYAGMDTTLRNCYLELTTGLNGETSPVSVVWNYLRQNHPAIELYQPDESHPSVAGSYAAACCFYTALFKKDPSLISYNPGLSAADASTIINTVKPIVFDSLQFWDFKRLPIATITYQAGPGINEVDFHAISHGVQQTYFWNFGDGDSSASAGPAHSYLSDGTYTVSLTTANCDLLGLHTSFTDTVIQFCNHTPTIFTSLPWLCNYDTLWTQTADSYQWFEYGIPLPEVNQFLPDYARYGISGFSVMSTLNGCSELSEAFAESPEWSGYYFDAMGDPCAGDTVHFAVLHTNGFLSGLENILWFKNDTLLSLMTNEDTLLITEPGKYECKVTNPGSNCPIDTTFYIIEFNCDGAGLEEMGTELFWTLFPNPASETITLKFAKFTTKESIEIFSAIGNLARVQTVSSPETKINIADLAAGLYYIQLKNNAQPPLRFLKR
ncbi:MAG TPA: T9SS type A sorting domain-containing protein [Chitinophagaceae bacterium]|nr:T9SS type A sorting domain-containing protein [Chitinophagaceae bacterium]